METSRLSSAWPRVSMELIFYEFTPVEIARAAMVSQEMTLCAMTVAKLRARSRGVALEEDETVWDLVKLMALGNGSRVRAGDSHTVTINNSGKLFGWGQNHYGQLGLGRTPYSLVPRLVPSTAALRVIQVSAGFSHTLALTSSGHVYSFGKGVNGQLGHGVERNEYSARRISALSGIETVCAGSKHSGVISLKGELWTFGSGAYGRLGHGDEATQLLPVKVGGALVGRFVTQVTAGLDHTVVISAFLPGGLCRDKVPRPTSVVARPRCWGDSTSLLSCSVFTMGLGLQGRLGHGTEANELRPRLVETLVGIRVTRITAGFNHTVCCTGDGKCFTFGRGLQGQLGHGIQLNELRPRQVAGLQDVVQVSAGARHTAVILKSGRIYSFGHGGYGRLGHGQNGDTGENEGQLLPKQILGPFAASKVMHISAGGSHNISLMQNGDVYSFGHGGFGKLGHDSEENESTPRKIDGLKAWSAWGS